MQVKLIQQSKLSEECWIVQFSGLSSCKTCEYKNTKECGGKVIRKTGKNNKGIVVSQNGLEY
jgi:hypothetical protein